MLKNFLLLNKHKIGFLIKVTSIIFISFLSIFLVLRYFLKDELPDDALLIAILLIGGIGFPLFIMILGFFDWALNRAAMNKMLSHAPFNQLTEIGFGLMKSGDHSKWQFTEEIMFGTLNNYAVFIHVERSNKKTIEFKVPVLFEKRLDKPEYKRLTQKYQEHEIGFSYGGFSKVYNVEKTKEMSISAFKKDLENYISEIKKEGFETTVVSH
jgi:hypothetical protein